MGEMRPGVTNDWAKEEIELRVNSCLPDKEAADLERTICNDAYAAYQLILNQGHSGTSINYMRNILNRLLDGKPLTPIEDKEADWHRWFEKGDIVCYQNRRMSSLFKTVNKTNGSVTYSDTSRVTTVVIEEDRHCSTWYNGFITGIVDEMFQIVLPYYPADKPYKVFVEEFSTDSKEDYDTMHVCYILMPDGEKTPVHRYYKEVANDFVEINEDEYEKRKERRAK